MNSRPFSNTEISDSVSSVSDRFKICEVFCFGLLEILNLGCLLWVRLIRLCLGRAEPSNGSWETHIWLFGCWNCIP